MKARVLIVLTAVVVSGRAAVAVPPTIHVTWEESPPPLQGTHYVISTDSPASPDFPDVRLLAGSLTWRVWSTDTDNPSSIGDIGVISCPAAADFGVKIRNSSDGPGARTVKGINLDPTNAANYSRITGGETTLDVEEGFFLQQASGGAGGDITGAFIIGGDVAGDVDVKVIAPGGSLVIEGAVSNGTITIDELKGAEDPLGPATLTIDGHLNGADLVIGRTNQNTDVTLNGAVAGDISVTDVLYYSTLYINGDLESVATITIQDMEQYSRLNLGNQTSDAIRGDVILVSGIPSSEPAVLVGGFLTSTGSIDLTNDNVAGVLALDQGGSGQIVNGGTITSTGQLRIGNAKSEVTFSGSAFFSAVSAGGSIDLTDGANLNGTIEISADMAGDISVEGDVLSNADIRVGGDLSGDVSIGESFDGTLVVSDDIAGEVTIAKKLKEHGRFFVDGLCTRSISVGENTEDLSLIHVKGGIGGDGSITINNGAGNFNADGDILVGITSQMTNITFDGSILIKKQSGSANGGDLNGLIRIVGCHANDDPLDICLCGGDGGSNISIIQTGCGATQAEGWSCIGGCP